MDPNCNFSAVLNYSDPANYDYFENCSFPGVNGGKITLPKVLNKDIETTFKLLFYIVAALQNILLLYVMYKDPMKRFRSAPSYFIANFTIADTLSIISGICDSVFQLNPHENFNKQEIAGCMQGIGIQASFIIIIIFALDRHFAIGHPFTYQNFVRRKLIVMILLVTPWCFAVTILPIIYFSPAHRYGTTLTKLFAGDIIALTCITLVVNPLTYWVFRTKMNSLKASNKQHASENLVVEKVLATTVVIVSASLIVFMFPYFVAFCFHLMDCDKCFLTDAFLSFWTYYPLLTAIRLTTNSAIYAWRLPLYWQSLKILLSRNTHRPRGNSGTTRRTQSASDSFTQIPPTPVHPRINYGLEFENNNRELNSIEMKDRGPELRKLSGSSNPNEIKIDVMPSNNDENQSVFDEKF